MCDMTHTWKNRTWMSVCACSHVKESWRTWRPIYMCDMTRYSYVRHDSFHLCDMTHDFFLCHVSLFSFVTWPIIPICVMTCVIHLCVMTHFYPLFMCVTWPMIHTCDMTHPSYIPTLWTTTLHHNVYVSVVDELLSDSHVCEVIDMWIHMSIAVWWSVVIHRVGWYQWWVYIRPFVKIFNDVYRLMMICIDSSLDMTLRCVRWVTYMWITL